MSLRTFIILAVLGFGAWKLLQPNPEKARLKAGLMPNDIAMLSIADCGNICTQAFADAQKRGMRVVQLDVDSEPGKALWAAFGSPNQFPMFLVQHSLVSQQDLRATMHNAFGIKTLTRVEQRFFAPHFGPGDRAKAVIYMASWCPACRALRNDLQATQTAFSEIDVERHPNSSQLSDMMQIGGFPTVYVGAERLNGSLDALADQIRERHLAN